MSDEQAQTVQFISNPTQIQATSLLAYRSAGHCLVIGELHRAVAFAEQTGLSPKTVLVPDLASGVVSRQATETGVKVFTASIGQLSGYLGNFDCLVGHGNESLAALAGASGGFDLVVDMCEIPLITVEVPPFGYYSAGQLDEQALTALTAELADMQGEFEKPRYFEYNLSLCAHSRSGIEACTRCLDVCATGAIEPAGEGIEINPYLCQGCGSCATVCPSGATRYAFPAPADAIRQLTALIDAHRQSYGGPIALLIHDSDKGQENIDAIKDQLPPGLLPVAVEETGSVGLDLWLNAFAQGAAAVLIDAPAAQSSTRKALQQQIDIAEQMLAPLGLAERLQLHDNTTPDGLADRVESLTDSGIAAATYQTFNDKRQSIRLAMDHLLAQRGSVSTLPESGVATLPAGSLFGQLQVARDACTLCLACVTVCPARALQDGETLPQLKFIESSCLQCGLCEQACPEDAISLMPAYRYDSEAARKPLVLNEETPFNCIVCNKPFATERIIGRMLSKLSGHWMFETDSAKRRLKMCDDCRVKDIFVDGESGIDVHR